MLSYESCYCIQSWFRVHNSNLPTHIQYGHDLNNANQFPSASCCHCQICQILTSVKMYFICEFSLIIQVGIQYRLQLWLAQLSVCSKRYTHCFDILLSKRGLSDEATTYCFHSDFCNILNMETLSTSP